MLRLNKIIGTVSDPDIAEALHGMQHADAVEYIVLEPQDAARRRIRARTDRGTDCAISLSRDERLRDGAVLLIESGRAIVVRLTETQWLPFMPADLTSALEIGHAAGNAHWRVRIKDGTLWAALEGPEEQYRNRVDALVASGRVRLVENPE